MSVQTFQVAIKALIRNNQGQILMVHIPKWNGNRAHWDLPGGRIDEGETFLETLKREIKEELSVDYLAKPQQLTALLTKITIPIGDIRMPLIYVIYEVKLPINAKIKLDPESAEDSYKWFETTLASKEMAIKFPTEFCDLVRGLK